MQLSILEHGDFQEALSRGNEDPHIESLRRSLRWHPPVAPAVKVHWDAATCDKNQKIGFGIVARDHDGAFLAGLSASMGSFSQAIIAEFR